MSTIKRGLDLMIGLTTASLIAGATAWAGDPMPINSPPDNRPFIYKDSVASGAYDPPGNFTNDKFPRIEHLFLPWEDVDLAFLSQADAYALERHRDILITIEPWTWSQTHKIRPGDLYANIMNGNYNPTVNKICGIISHYKSVTTIRWAQEMEEPLGRFTWQYWRPDSYKKAYRFFAEQCRAIAPNAKFMWSPKGLANLADFYPGDDVVDSIGLSVFGYQPFDQGEFGRDQHFAELLAPGYERTVGFGKPIWVAELGYSGDKAYVANWQKEVEIKYPQFPKLEAIVYFNDKEVWPWMKNYGLPDWRVDKNIISGSLTLQ
jgi:beta-mannanase